MYTNSFIYYHLFVFAWIETRLECNEINVTSVSFTYVMYWNMKTNVTTCGNMFTNVVNMYFFFFVANQAYDISVSALVIVILSLLGWVLKYCSKRPTFSASSTLDGQYLQQRYRWSSSDNRLKEAWTSSIWKRRRRGRKTLPVAVATTWGTSKLVSNLCSRRY